MAMQPECGRLVRTLSSLTAGLRSPCKMWPSAARWSQRTVLPAVRDRGTAQLAAQMEGRMEENGHWELRMVWVPNGAHLSSSAKTPGHQRDLLREDGTNKLMGPTESRRITDDDLAEFGLNRTNFNNGDDEYDADREPDSARQKLLQDLAEYSVYFICKFGEVVGREYVIPKVKEYAPAAKQKVRSFVSSLFNKESAVNSNDAAAGTEIDIPKISMSSQQFRELLAKTLIADEIAARMKLQLSNARIDDGQLPLELEDAIHKVLVGDRSSIDDVTWSKLIEFVNDGHTENVALPQKNSS